MELIDGSYPGIAPCLKPDWIHEYQSGFASHPHQRIVKILHEPVHGRSAKRVVHEYRADCVRDTERRGVSKDDFYIGARFPSALAQVMPGNLHQALRKLDTDNLPVRVCCGYARNSAFAASHVEENMVVDSVAAPQPAEYFSQYEIARRVIVFGHGIIRAEFVNRDGGRGRDIVKVLVIALSNGPCNGLSDAFEIPVPQTLAGLIDQPGHTASKELNCSGDFAMLNARRLSFVAACRDSLHLRQRVREVPCRVRV